MKAGVGEEDKHLLNLVRGALYELSYLIFTTTWEVCSDIPILQMVKLRFRNVK